MADQTKNQIDVPVQFFLRITRRDNDPRERALLIAKDEKGRMFTFEYEDFVNDQYKDLIVCDLPNDKDQGNS